MGRRGPVGALSYTHIHIGLQNMKMLIEETYGILLKILYCPLPILLEEMQKKFGGTGEQSIWAELPKLETSFKFEYISAL